MPRYNRYQKLQKYYLGVPVNPPEYKQGGLITTGEWETIEDCETEDSFLWKDLDNEYICEEAQPIERYVVKPGEYMCDNFNKYYVEKLQYCYGQICVDAVPEQTRTGSLIEQNSIDCGYTLNIPISQTVFGDICLRNKNNGDFRFINLQLLDEINSDEYYLIGFVVVPGLYNIYGDGSCAVMSAYNYSWIADTFGLNSNVAGISSFTNKIENIELLKPDYPFMNYIYGISDYHDPETARLYSILDTAHDPGKFQVIEPHLVPEQYIKDNVASDVNGRLWTNMMVELHNVPNWKTASTILPPSGGDYILFNMAAYMYRFAPEGTEPGDWYLPAAGEVAYANTKKREYNNILDTLRYKYGYKYVLRIEDNNLSSCFHTSNLIKNEYNGSTYYYTVNITNDYNFFNGDIDNNGNSCGTYPFIRINNNGIVR